MNAGAIIIILISLFFIVGITCLIVDCFVNKPKVYYKKTKPKPSYSSYENFTVNFFENDDLIIKD